MVDDADFRRAAEGSLTDVELRGALGSFADHVVEPGPTPYNVHEGSANGAVTWPGPVDYVLKNVVTGQRIQAVYARRGDRLVFHSKAVLES